MLTPSLSLVRVRDDNVAMTGVDGVANLCLVSMVDGLGFSSEVLHPLIPPFVYLRSLPPGLCLPSFMFGSSTSAVMQANGDALRDRVHPEAVHTSSTLTKTTGLVPLLHTHLSPSKVAPPRTILGSRHPVYLKFLLVA